MPKRIENIPEQLLTEAGRQIADLGYGKTTIRSVAGACGIAAGTVYNYFSSKEEMIAAYVARDWRDSPEACLRTIYEELSAFTRKHAALFSDPEAAKAAAGVLVSRHLQLREQLAAFIAPFAPSPDGFKADFLAEALLTWTVSGVPFGRIYEMMEKLIAKEGEPT